MHQNRIKGCIVAEVLGCCSASKDEPAIIYQSQAFNKKSSRKFGVESLSFNLKFLHIHNN